MKSPLNVVVGETYQVPSALSRYNDIIPIMYPKHTDGEEICVTPVEEHFHIDKRFFKTDLDAYLGKALYDFQYREMTCIKEETKIAKNYVFMIERLHRLYQNSEVSNGHCPYQGLKILNSCGTCPGHGLIWDMDTGKLKYKLPFYLVNGENKAEIINSSCKIVIKNLPLKTTYGQITLQLVDSNGQEYPSAVFLIDHVIASLGDIINIDDKQCSEKHKDTI